MFPGLNLAHWPVVRYLALEFAVARGTSAPFTYTDLFNALAPRTGVRAKSAAQAQADGLVADGLLTVNTAKRPKEYAITPPGVATYHQLHAAIAPGVGISQPQLVTELDAHASSADGVRELADALAMRLRALRERV